MHLDDVLGLLGYFLFQISVIVLDQRRVFPFFRIVHEKELIAAFTPPVIQITYIDVIIPPVRLVSELIHLFIITVIILKLFYPGYQSIFKQTVILNAGIDIHSGDIRNDLLGYIIAAQIVKFAVKRNKSRVSLFGQRIYTRIYDVVQTYLVYDDQIHDKGQVVERRHHIHVISVLFAQPESEYGKQKRDKEQLYDLAGYIRLIKICISKDSYPYQKVNKQHYAETGVKCGIFLVKHHYTVNQTILNALIIYGIHPRCKNSSVYDHG